MILTREPTHVVVVVGGAVAGSEAAAAIASRGALAIVLDQNARPYGKIEDGLPRWHEALRAQEYARIGVNLTQPNVLFVPKTRVGRDVTLDELTSWGVSAVVLANGAWRDRPLGVPGIDAFVGKGLVYQNSFIYWFNHFLEESYDGPRWEAVDDAVVVGGGLASIDVVKVLSLETFGRALRARGIEASMHDLERHGIGTMLQKHGLTPEALGVKGPRLFYRRRKRDMPLATAPDRATPEQLKKVETIREKVMDVCIKKYLVRFEECHAPVGFVERDGQLVGIRFRRTEVRDGKLAEIAGSDYDVAAPLVISSIGSIPEPMPGITLKGELYPWASWDTGELSGRQGVFGLGNVLTGKGNIKASRENALEISEHVLQSYLGIAPTDGATAIADAVHRAAAAEAARVADGALTGKPRVAPDDLTRIMERVRALWATSGYAGDYAEWIARVTPHDLG